MNSKAATAPPEMLEIPQAVLILSMLLELIRRHHPAVGNPKARAGKTAASLTAVRSGKAALRHCGLMRPAAILLPWRRLYSAF